jgi:hypothetical protein
MDTAMAEVKNGRNVEDAAADAVKHMLKSVRTDLGEKFDTMRARMRVGEALEAYKPERAPDPLGPSVLYRMVAPGRFVPVSDKIVAVKSRFGLTKRKTAVAVAAAAFAVTALFPPWLHTFDVTSGHRRWDAGYAFILSPPQPNGSTEYHGQYHGIQLDTTRLLVEWACILAIGGAAWLLLGDASPRPGTASGQSQRLGPIP